MIINEYQSFVLEQSREDDMAANVRQATETVTIMKALFQINPKILIQMSVCLLLCFTPDTLLNYFPYKIQER